MALTGYCGERACSDCKTPCRLDESIPCSPDCENLTEEGQILVKKCLESGCEEVKFIFGMEGAADEEVLAAIGESAPYPYGG